LHVTVGSGPVEPPPDDVPAPPDDVPLDDEPALDAVAVAFVTEPAGVTANHLPPSPWPFVWPALS